MIVLTPMPERLIQQFVVVSLVLSDEASLLDAKCTRCIEDAQLVIDPKYRKFTHWGPLRLSLPRALFSLSFFIEYIVSFKRRPVRFSIGVVVVGLQDLHLHWVGGEHGS